MDRSMIKPLLWGVVGGAIIAAFGSVQLGFLHTTSTVDNRTQAAVAAALTPGCVNQARSDPDFVKKFDDIKGKRQNSQRYALEQAGWATLPGMDRADRALAESCLAVLQAEEAAT